MSGFKPLSCIITFHINCPHIQSSQLCARCENNADSTSADSCTQVIEKARLRSDTSVLTKNNVTYTNMPGMCQVCYNEDLKTIGEQFDHYVTTSERRMKRLRIARDNAPNASLRLKVIEEIVTEDLKLRNWQGDRDRAMKGLELRMGESPSSAVNGEPTRS